MTTKREPENKQILLLDDDGKTAGALEYMVGGGNELFATSTHVDSAYEGRGYGRILVDDLADYARESGATVTPICPYVIHLFKKYPDKYGDVMKKQG